MDSKCYKGLYIAEYASTNYLVFITGENECTDGWSVRPESMYNVFAELFSGDRYPSEDYDNLQLLMPTKLATFDETN